MTVLERKRAAAVPVSVERGGRRAGRIRLRSRILVTAVAAVLAAYFLVPVYWLVVASTKTTGGLFGSNGLWFSRPRFFQNMVDLFTYDSGIYLRWMGNSLVYAGLGSVVSTLICAAAGYALAKFEFRGRELVFNVVLGGVLVPATAMAFPLYLMFGNFQLADTYWAVLLPSFVNPFGVYLLRIYASASVPTELLEAGRVDGAGEARIFFGIVLRILTPALVTALLFQFVGIWNNYFLPLVMLSDPQLYPITLGLASWQSFTERVPRLYQLTVGGAFVSIIPLVIAILALQRFWRAGLTKGSVKG